MAYLNQTGQPKEEEEPQVPLAPEEEEEELTDEELDEAQKQGEATAKAISGPPQNKAMGPKSSK